MANVCSSRDMMHAVCFFHTMSQYGKVKRTEACKIDTESQGRLFITMRVRFSL